VSFVCHLEGIGFAVATRRMDIGRIAVKQSFGIVVEAYDFDCRAIFNLDYRRALSTSEMEPLALETAMKNSSRENGVRPIASTSSLL
jgi:hypothetical protein